MSVEVERRLADFFLAIADGEIELEFARQRLCRIPDFTPR